jgi:hypothetical protein
MNAVSPSFPRADQAILPMPGLADASRWARSAAQAGLESELVVEATRTASTFWTLLEQSLHARTVLAADHVLVMVDGWRAALLAQVDWSARFVVGQREMPDAQEIHRAWRDTARWGRVLTLRTDARIQGLDLIRTGMESWMEPLHAHCRSLPDVRAAPDPGLWAPVSGEARLRALRRSWASRSAGPQVPRAVPASVIALAELCPRAMDLAMDWQGGVSAALAGHWRRFFGAADRIGQTLLALGDRTEPLALRDLQGLRALVEEECESLRDDLLHDLRAVQQRLCHGWDAALAHWMDAMRGWGTFLVSKRRIEASAADVVAQRAEWATRLRRHQAAWKRLLTGLAHACALLLDAQAMVGAVWYALHREGHLMHALFERHAIQPARAVQEQSRCLLERLALTPDVLAVEELMEPNPREDCLALHTWLVEHGPSALLRADVRADFDASLQELVRSVTRATQRVQPVWQVADLTQLRPDASGPKAPPLAFRSLPLRELAERILLAQILANVETSRRLLADTLENAQGLTQGILRAVDLHLEAARQERSAEHENEGRALQVAHDLADQGISRAHDKAARLVEVSLERQALLQHQLQETIRSTCLDLLQRARELNDRKVLAQDPQVDWVQPEERPRAAAAATAPDVQSIDGLTDWLRASNFAPAAHPALPETYRRLFLTDDRHDALGEVAHDHAVAAMQSCLRAWQQGEAESLAVVGMRGLGKSSIVQHFLSGPATDTPSIRIDLSTRIHTADGLARRLCDAFNVPAGEDIQQLEQRLLQRGDRQIVCVTSAERLFLRHPRGLDAIRALLGLIHATSERILWVVSLEQAAFDFLHRTLHLTDALTTVIQARPLSAPQLRAFLLGRHDLCGREVVPAGTSRPEELLDRYFVQLHALSGGYPPLAVYLWLRSIQPGDGDAPWRLYPPPAWVRGDVLHALEGMACAALASIVLHGGLHLDELARTLRLPRTDAAAILSQLRHTHLVEGRADCPAGFQVNRVAFSTLSAALRRRNLL